jgi:hypothetical protein
MYMASVQHNDFGEKIGGAKKDLWQKRGLLSDDLSEMNEREADKYVKKDNTWKKPDYQALIDSGIPADAVFYIKTVRDSLETAPIYYRIDDTPEKRLDRQKEYIDTVREVQTVIEGVRCKADVLDAFNKIMINGGYYEELRPGISGSYYSATEKGRKNSTITDKLSRAMLIRSEWDYRQKITNKMEKAQFGVSKENKIPKGFEIKFNDGKHSWSANNDWKPDTYFVAKGPRIIQKNFDTHEAALKWVQDFAQERSGNGKKRFVPPQLESVKRDGTDYRRGKNISGEDYLKTFGFKGGEFGNWMTQLDRQASLNFGYDALKDLAAALKISDKDISYQGELSIAFGARGSGNAAAHYEPLRNVINLTKMNGAGSLAHEWWHGLDDFLGKKLNKGGYISERPYNHPLFKKLLDTIKYKQASPEQAAAAAEATTARIKRNAERWTQSYVMACPPKADEKTKTEYAKLHEAFLRGEEGSVDKLNELKKAVTGRVIPKSERETLISYENLIRSIAEKTEPSALRVDTDYYRNSKEMGKICEKDGNYWDSDVELTARAFATYIFDTLPNRSDYLAGHAESAINFTMDESGNMEIIRAYPEGEERKAINAVFDEIIADLKLQQYLTHDDRVQPETIPVPEPKRPNIPRRFEMPPDNESGIFHTPGEQLSLFDDVPQKTASKKPSILGGLETAKTVVAQTDKQTSETGKKREAESL